MRYEPALDGLRAVAILGVLVFHVFPQALPGGFTGVDVFFVLSGYLIASVILVDLRAGDFSLREFYLRRIQRLLPNALAMMACTLAVASAVLLPGNLAQVGEHALWALANLSNLFVRDHFGDYWQDVAGSSPLLHTWSLAVEEQFYLLLPLTLSVLWRRRGRTAFAVVASIACGSYLLAVVGTVSDPQGTFYLLPTRAWEPLLGAALALYRVPTHGDPPLSASRPGNALLGWLGLALILVAYLFLSGEQGFPGWVVLLPVSGAFALLAADPATGAARLLAHPIPVRIGRLSYSIYLWHWPAIVLGRAWCELEGLPAAWGTVGGATLGLLLSIVAYLAVERPLRRRGSGRSRRMVLVAAAFALCTASAFRTARNPTTIVLADWFDPVHSAMQSYNSARVGAPLTHAPRKYSDVVWEPFERSSVPAWKSGGIVHEWGPGAPQVVLLGSSHALMYGKLLDDICSQLALPVSFLTAHATDVDFDRPDSIQEFDAARRRFLDAWRPRVVLVVDRWDRYGKRESAAAIAHRLRSVVDAVGPTTQRVLLFSQPPVLRIGEQLNLREYTAWRRIRTGAFPAIAPDEREPLRRATIVEMEALAAREPKVRILRADLPFYLPDGSVRYASGRTFHYLDDDHLSTEGAELLREAITRAIRDEFDEPRSPSRP